MNAQIQNNVTQSAFGFNDQRRLLVWIDKRGWSDPYRLWGAIYHKPTIISTYVEPQIVTR